jgi:hypothetical protein
MWPNNMAAFGWMPWVIWSAELAGREGGRQLLLSAALGGLQMLSGAPEIILFTWLIVFARGVVNWKEPDVKPAQRLRRFAGVVLLVTGLSAVQLAPFLDLLAHSERERGYAGTSWAMAGWGWVNLLAPLFRCFQVSGGVFLQTGQVWTSSYYVGVITLVLGVFGLVRGRNREVLFLAVVFVMGLILALGDAGYLYHGLRLALPPAGLMRYPIKFIVLSVFAAPLLGAWGLARYQRLGDDGDKTVRSSLLLTVGAFIIVLGSILVYVRLSPPFRDTATWPVLWPNTAVRIALLGLTAAMLLSLARWKSLAPRLVFLFMVWLDLVSHVPRQNPTIEPALLDPGWVRARLGLDSLPGLGQGRVATHPDSQRVFGRLVFPDPTQQYAMVRTAWDGSCNLLDRVPKLGGMFSLHLREMERVHSELRSSFDSLDSLRAYVGISHVGVLRQTIEWLPHPGALSWVTLGQTPEFVDDETALRMVLSPGFAPLERVYLPVTAKGSVGTVNRGDGRILWSRFGTEQIELEVEARAPACVVIAQAFYHPWKAYVDGNPAPLWRANYAFQATVIPAGRHTVVLRYVDRVFQIGMIVSILTFALGVVWGFRGRLFQTRTPGLSDAVVRQPGITDGQEPAHKRGRR